MRVSADPSDRCRERILTFIHKLEMYRTWPTNAGTRFSSLSQKNTTSARPIAPLVRWWESPRAVAVADWKTRSNVTWDACSKFFVGNVLSFCTKSNLRATCGYFAHAKRVLFDNAISDPVATVTSMLPNLSRLCCS